MRLVALRDIHDYIGVIASGTLFVQPDDALARQWIEHGVAREESSRPRLPWAERHAVILASGPSLTGSQCAVVRTWRDADRGARMVIAINTTFRIAPWADLLYACDMRWWQKYADEAFSGFAGEFWTQDAQAKRKFDRLNLIKSVRGAGASKKDGVIHQGGGASGPGNGGYQAVDLAAQRGASKITLLGFDMRLGAGGAKHHHPDHPGHLNTSLPFKQWIAAFDALARDLAHVDIVNCTPASALKAFQTADLAARLAE